MKPEFELLTIQKFVFLLHDFHYTEFTEFLRSSRAALPLKLVESIRGQLPAFDDLETLCSRVYGASGKKEKLNFNQLSYYTMRLSGYLAQNYPGYLLHNIQIIQHTVNEGHKDQAAFIGELLLDISEKVEDFQTTILVLKFFIQQAYLHKDALTGRKYTDRLFSTMESDRLCWHIINTIRTDLNISLSRTKNISGLEKYKNEFRELQNHPSVTVNMLSKFALIYIIYYFEPEQFATPTTNALLEDLQRGLNKNSFLVYFFLFDIKTQFGFYKLNSATFNYTSKEGKKEFEDFDEHRKSVKYWKTYLNIPEIQAITIKASQFLSQYHYHLHRKDYYKVISAKDLKELQELAIRCEEILENKSMEEVYRGDFINLKLIYSGILVLLGGDHVKRGVDELERLLITFQQINLTGSSDSIFVILMIGYFAMKDYDTCADTYKRYQYIVKDKPVFEDNDIGIHTYYYLSKWLSTHRQQYLSKIKANYDRTLNNESYAEPRKAIEEFVDYFKIPVSLLEQQEETT